MFSSGQLADLLKEALPALIQRLRLSINDGYGAFLFGMLALGLSASLAELAAQIPVEDSSLFKSLIAQKNEPLRDDDRAAFSALLSPESGPPWVNVDLLEATRDFVEALMRRPRDGSCVAAAAAKLNRLAPGTVDLSCQCLDGVDGPPTSTRAPTGVFPPISARSEYSVFWSPARPVLLEADDRAKGERDPAQDDDRRFKERSKVLECLRQLTEDGGPYRALYLISLGGALRMIPDADVPTTPFRSFTMAKRVQVLLGNTSKVFDKSLPYLDLADHGLVLTEYATVREPGGQPIAVLGVDEPVPRDLLRDRLALLARDLDLAVVTVRGPLHERDCADGEGAASCVFEASKEWATVARGLDTPSALRYARHFVRDIDKHAGEPSVVSVAPQVLAALIGGEKEEHQVLLVQADGAKSRFRWEALGSVFMMMVALIAIGRSKGRFVERAVAAVPNALPAGLLRVEYHNVEHVILEGNARAEELFMRKLPRAHGYSALPLVHLFDIIERYVVVDEVGELRCQDFSVIREARLAGEVTRFHVRAKKTGQWLQVCGSPLVLPSKAIEGFASIEPVLPDKQKALDDVAPKAGRLEA